MLVVNASAGRSSIHGKGLFARQFIPKGTVIWMFEPTFDSVIPLEKLPHLPAAEQKKILRYAFFSEAKNAFILSNDDDRFTNHSEEPNTRSSEDYTFAIRDIEAGEEITADYNEINMDHSVIREIGEAVSKSF